MESKIILHQLNELTKGFEVRMESGLYGIFSSFSPSAS